MKNNLIPPFVMREAGIRVNDTPKIQTIDPTEKDHSMCFPETDFRIPLSSWGMFSYFVTSRPTAKQMMEAEDVCMLTPSSINPHCDAYATNEENMLDWEGNMAQGKDGVQILLSDVQEDVALAASVQVSSAEARAIDTVLEGNGAAYDEEAHPCWKPVPRAADEVSSMLASVSPTFDDQTLHGRLAARAKLGKFKASIGSTNASGGEHLTDDDSATQPLTDDDTSDSDSDEDDDQALDQTHDSVTKGEIDLDERMISATHATKSKGVDPAHLSKVWRIDLNTAERTLEVVSELNRRVDDPTLSRNYGANDRMLRCKRIDELFFMDTFFATKKSGKSSRGHTCCQLFLTDKGFVYVVPMKSKAEVLQAAKQFAKEIGAPDAITCDVAGKQTSHSLKKFCNEIGATLKVLEEGTPWSNKAELHIGLIKEAVRKDMKISDCPLAFWDYCVERRARINNLTAKDVFTLHGSNPHADLTGEEGDMSNLCQHKWCDWCYSREQKNKFPYNREVLGRVLGPAKGAGNEMAQWILKANGNVAPRRSSRPLKVDEIHSATELKKRAIFDGLIERRWGTSINPPKSKDSDNLDDDNEFEECESEDERKRTVPDIEGTVDANGKLLNQQPAYDKILHSEVSLQLGESMTVGRVTKRALGPDGTVAGTYDENPCLNTMT